MWVRITEMNIAIDHAPYGSNHETRRDGLLSLWESDRKAFYFNLSVNSLEKKSI